MRISIIIPTYNCAKYIKKAIDSILNQPYEDKELIVIDGNSKDNTVEILKSYGEKIKWISEKDNGQSDAINKGFKIATGEIITWLNADDYYEPDIFNEINSTFETNKEVVLVYGNQRSISKNSIIVNKPPKNLTVQKLICNGNYINQPSSFYLSNAIKKINYLDNSLNYWMEYDLFIKLLKNGSSKYIDKVLANFIIRPDQKSNQKNIIEMDKELFKISRKHGGCFVSKILFSIVYHRLTKYLKNKF